MLRSTKVGAEMFNSIRITGFRGFKRLELDGLDRFSLILGRNNVGKTAVLEAIYLLAGPTNPELSLRVNVFRGIDQFRNDPDEIWGWLFHGKKTDHPVTLQVFSNRTNKKKRPSRKITLELREPREVELTGKKKGDSKSQHPNRLVSASTRDSLRQLNLTYDATNGETVESRAIVTERGLRIECGHTQPLPNSVFVHSRSGYSEENPGRFSKLEEVGEESNLIHALQVLEPRLRRLSVLVTGGVPILHGDIGIGRMIPLPFLGDGIGRLVTLLLAIASSRDAIVMVDEIESGFHYSVLKDVWTALATMARRYNVQLFATTHSWECLKAAHESFRDGEVYDFRLHRLDRVDDDVKSTTFDEEMIDQALLAGMELR